jgi:hypothetical protein
MKKTVLSIFLCLITLTVSVQAQSNIRGSRRLSDAADRLASQTADLSERIYNDFRNRTNTSRSDLDALFLAQQIDSGARLFQQLVRDNRRNAELRDAAAILADLSRRAPTGFGQSSASWRDVRTTIDEIQREAGGGGGFGDNRDRDRDNRDGRNDNDDFGNDMPRRTGARSGSVTWRGMVDIEVQLVIRGGSLETRTISGTTFNNENFNFTSALPNRRVTVEVNKTRGRGRVNILQQPTRSNDFTTVIQIIDKDGGAKDYEVEVYWQ